MKNLKGLSLAVVLFAFTTAIAQHGPENHYKKQNGSVIEQNYPAIEQLNLSAEQKSKLKDIRKEYALKDSNLFSELNKKKDQVKEERLKSIKSILNKEQFVKFEKLQAEKKEFKHQGKQKGMQQNASFNKLDGRQMGKQQERRMGGQEGRKMGKQIAFGSRTPNHQKMDPIAKDRGKSVTVENRAMKQTDRLDRVLDLTDKQAYKILKINNVYSKKDSALFAGLPGNNKAGEVDKEALKKEFLAIKDAKNKEISKVLENYQNAKFESLIKTNKN